MRLNAAAALFFASSLLASEPIQITRVVWKDAPPSLPAGSKVAVLEGDPKAEGVFTMRVKLPAGSQILPHEHPKPERVTVISGEVRLGFGDTFAPSKMKRLGAGSFYINPPESHHFLYFPRTTVVQITGEGPWTLRYINNP